MRINKFRRKKNLWSRLKFWQKEKPKPKKKFRWIKRFLVLGLGFTAFLFVYGIYFLPDVKDAAELNFAESTIIYDRGALEPGARAEEHILYVIHGDENRDYIPLEEISPWVAQATIAIEDDQFYSHFGFDVPALVKVFLHEVFGIGPQRGGSTITQQLAKQVFLSGERSYTRKFKELLLSIKLEWHYSKDEILELYLNKIPYGNNAFGIEAAARTYFGKSARDVTIAEATILASIPVAPTRFSPYGSNKDLLLGFYEYDNFSTEAEARAAEINPIDAEASAELETLNAEVEADENFGKLRVYKKGRKDLVLQRMLDLEMITENQFYQAWSEANTLEFRRGVTDIAAPHFVFYVREQVEAKFGQEFLSQGGLQIYTTLDPQIQAQAEETIRIKTEGYENVYGAENVAMAAINPDNGEILAYIGGKDWFNIEADGQVDVLTSRRQPGSSFKPLVYAAAFMTGFSPSTNIFDVETDFGGDYVPQNFNEKFQGPVSARSALNESLNIPAIKLAALAGANKVLELTGQLGIPFEGDADMHGVAIGVGVAEIEPLAHISSFQAFAGDGTINEPVAILEIRNASGNVLEKFEPGSNKKEGLDAQIAALVRNVLTDEKSRPTTNGFDWNTFLELAPELNSGAKTGTSNRVIPNPSFIEAEPESDNNRRFLTVPGDSWTIGFTPHLVSGVWVGNNRGKPMKSGATGMTVAAPVWKNFMDEAHKILIENGADPEKTYNEPTPLVEVEINRLTGKRVTDSTPAHLRVNEVYPSYALPTELDIATGTKNINIFTGEDATEETPEFAVREINFLPLTALRQDPNWLEPAQTWMTNHPIFMNSLGAVMDPEKIEAVENPEITVETEGWVVPVQFLADLPVNLQRRWRQVQNQAKQQGTVPDWNLIINADNDSGPNGDFDFQIISPRNSVEPGTIEVEIDVERGTDLAEVSYFWNDRLIYKAVREPFTGLFRVPNNARLGTTHEIKAIAMSSNFTSAEDVIEVIVERESTANSNPNSSISSGDGYNGPAEITFLGPLANQRVSLNSEAQIVALIAGSQIETVEFLLNNQSLGFKNTPPFVMNFTTPEQMGRQTLTIKVTNNNGIVSERSIPITVARERFSEVDTPSISEVDKNFRTLSVTTRLPNFADIEEAQIRVSQPNQILYEETWAPPNKFKYIFVPTSGLRGTVDVELFTKLRGEADFRQVDSQIVRY
jgi:membrane peptidoglycan carboxypeptidase